MSVLSRIGQLPLEFNNMLRETASKMTNIKKQSQRIAEYVKLNYSYCFMIASSLLLTGLSAQAHLTGVVAGAVVTWIICLPIMDRTSQEPHQRLYTINLLFNFILAFLIYYSQNVIPNLVTYNAILLAGSLTGALVAWKVIHSY